MKVVLIFGIVTMFVLQIVAQTPPTWGGNPRYTVKVGMVNNDPKVNWTFTYFYDWSQKAERYEHGEGQEDEFCLLAQTPFSKGGLPCVATFANDGWGYISYPTKNFCCKCTKSFGAINYNWLKDNSTYEGITTIDGKSVTHWTKQGLYLNHYYSTVDKQLPVYFHEIKKGNPKDWIFHLDTYSTGPIDPAKLGPQCSTRCLGTCDFFAEKDANLQTS